MKRLSIIAFLIILLFSCKEENLKVLSYDHDIELKDSKYSMSKSNIKVLFNQDRYLIHYFNDLDSNIIFYDENTKTYDSIDVSSIFKYGTNKKTFDYYVLNLDSIFFLLDNNVICLLANRENRIMKWTITNSIENFGNEYILYAYGEHLPISFNKGCLYVHIISDKYDLKSPENRILFYSLPSYARIELLQDESYTVSLIGEYPTNYRKERYVGLSLPILHINWNDEILISYANDQNLQLIKNYRSDNIKCSFNNFIQSNPYPEDSSSTNYSFYKSYLLSQNEFSGFAINNQSRLLFRIFRKGTSPIKNEFEIPTPKDKPWTLLVYNANFELYCMHDFNNSLKYSPGTVLPYKNGVLIRNNELSNEKLYLSYFKMY